MVMTHLLTKMLQEMQAVSPLISSLTCPEVFQVRFVASREQLQLEI